MTILIALIAAGAFGIVLVAMYAKGEISFGRAVGLFALTAALAAVLA